MKFEEIEKGLESFAKECDASGLREFFSNYNTVKGSSVSVNENERLVCFHRCFYKDAFSDNEYLKKNVIELTAETIEFFSDYFNRYKNAKYVFHELVPCIPYPSYIFNSDLYNARYSFGYYPGFPSTTIWINFLVSAVYD